MESIEDNNMEEETYMDGLKVCITFHGTENGVAITNRNRNQNYKIISYNWVPILHFNFQGKNTLNHPFYKPSFI